MYNTIDENIPITEAIEKDKKNQVVNFYKIENSTKYAVKKRKKDGENFSSDTKRFEKAEKFGARYIGTIGNKIVVKIGKAVFAMSINSFKNKENQISCISKRNSNAEIFLTNFLNSHNAKFLREVSIKEIGLLVKNSLSPENFELLHKVDRAIVDFAVVTKNIIFLIALNGSQHSERFDAAWKNIKDKKILENFNCEYIAIDTKEYKDNEEDRQMIVNTLYPYLNLGYYEDEVNIFQQVATAKASLKTYMDAISKIQNQTIQEKFLDTCIDFINEYKIQNRM